MTFGLDANGLQIKRVADIKEELENSFRATFGQAINLDARSLLGQIIGVVAEREGLVWELLEEVYFSQYPDTSEGLSLDNVAAITGTTRKAATKSIGVVTLIGDAGTVVPSGSVVSVQGNDASRFATDEDATILAGTNAQQSLVFSSAPSSGTFRLQFKGETTDPIDWNATAGNIETELEQLSTLTAVTVTGDFVSGFNVLYQGSDGLQPQELLVVTANLLVSTEAGTIQTVADVAGSLDRAYFIAQDSAGSVAFWIDVDDSGSSIPAGASSADRAVEVTTINANDSADTVATKLAAAMLADSAFSAASAATNTVSYTSADEGDLTDIADGDTSFTFAVSRQGYDAGDLPIAVADVVLGVFPQVDVQVTAEDAGEIQAPAGTLNVIETPVSGWDSVINELDIVVGTDTEADQALKLRRLQEIAIAGKGTLDSIFAALISLTNVSTAVVFQNNSALEDTEGRPPHSLDIVVEGGDEDEIAETIFDTIAAGIETIGDITKTVQDSQGFNQLVKFSRPDEVLIYIDVDLTVDNNSFPSNGADSIEQIIVDFGNSIGIGNDVIVVPQLICSFGNIPGILDIVIKIGTAALPTAGSANIVAADAGGILSWILVSHGLVDNNRITFSNVVGALPTGVSAGTVYHVVNSTTNNFQIATERGGDPIAFTDSGTGTQVVNFGGEEDNILIAPREVSKWDSTRTNVNIV